MLCRDLDSVGAVILALYKLLMSATLLMSFDFSFWF